MCKRFIHFRANVRGIATQQRITRVYALRPGTFDPSTSEASRSLARATKTQQSVSLVASRAQSPQPSPTQPPPSRTFADIPYAKDLGPTGAFSLTADQLSGIFSAQTAFERRVAIGDASVSSIPQSSLQIAPAPVPLTTSGGGGDGLTSFLGGSTTALLLLGLAAVF